MILTFSFSLSSISINSVNRSLLYLPIELLQSYVNIIEVDSVEDLYFKKDPLMDALDIYFESSLSHHVLSYQVTYLFTDSDNSMVCLSDRCQGINITVNADIYFDVHYEKTMFYSIGEK